MRSILALILLVLFVAWLLEAAWSSDSFGLHERWVLTGAVAALIMVAFAFSFARGYRRG
jgi:hypothetical protein